MNCGRIGKAALLLLALLLAGCRVQPVIKPDVIVDIPLNPTEAVTQPVTEVVTQPPATEPPTQEPTQAPTEVRPTEAPTPPPVTEPRIVEDTALERKLAAAVNARREAAGLEPLPWDSTLASRADLRAAELVTVVSHQRPDGSGWETVLGSHGYGFTAEVIYFGWESAAAIAERWSNDSVCRRDILSEEASALGVGACTAGGTTYLVLILAG